METKLTQMDGTMKYTVETRYGWGWKVVGDRFESHPIESAIAAQDVADALNEGSLFADAVVQAKLRFDSGRFYCIA